MIFEASEQYFDMHEPFLEEARGYFIMGIIFNIVFAFIFILLHYFYPASSNYELNHLGHDLHETALTTYFTLGFIYLYYGFLSTSYLVGYPTVVLLYRRPDSVGGIAASIADLIIWLISSLFMVYLIGTITGSVKSCLDMLPFISNIREIAHFY